MVATPRVAPGPRWRFRDLQVRVMLGFLAGHGHDGVVVALPIVQVRVSFAFRVRASPAIGIARGRRFQGA